MFSAVFTKVHEKRGSTCEVPVDAILSEETVSALDVVILVCAEAHVSSQLSGWKSRYLWISRISVRLVEGTNSSLQTLPMCHSLPFIRVGKLSFMCNKTAIRVLFLIEVHVNTVCILRRIQPMS